MFQFLLFFLFINTRLCFNSPKTIESRTKKDAAYVLLKTFLAYKGEISIKPGQVKEFDLVDMDLNNLDFAEKIYVENYMPDWKGEKYEVKLYKWLDTSFVFIRKYYTDQARNVNTSYDEFDLTEARNLKLPDKFLEVNEVMSLLKGALVKAYAVGDLNFDKKEDLVLVYMDTTLRKPKFINNSIQESHFIIFENRGEGKYEKIFSLDYPGSLILAGKIEIIDVTKDNQPEIIYWKWSQGASGWTIVADVYTRIEEK